MKKTLSLILCLYLTGITHNAWCQGNIDDPGGGIDKETSILGAAKGLLSQGSEGGEMSVLGLVNRLGWIFKAPFLLFSIWAVYLVLANLLILSESRLVPTKIARTARDSLARGDTIGVRRLVESHSDLVSLMLQVGLARAGEDPTIIETAMEGRISQDLVRLRSRIRYLADIANITPMIGLLGTVWGLLQVFEAVAGNSSTVLIGNVSSKMSEGIAHAMVATVIGLTIAIPSLAFYALFRSKMARIIGRLESFGTDLAELLSHQAPQGGSRGGEGGTEPRR
jgi:biopolymer transport protein ExbB